MAMNKNEYYILNPAYFLRNDVRRAVIGTFDFPDIEEHLYEKNALHIIHPITASMLSFFDGKNTLHKCISLISEYFCISVTDTEKIIERYIYNSEPLYIQYNDDYIILPINTLIKKQHYERSESYTASEFEIKEEVNLKSMRLYKPVKIIIEMNFTCYTECKYCYADRKNPKAIKALDSDKLEDLIYQCRKMNIPSIEINGGEVLLHPQIEKILTTMSQCGYHPFISTKIPLSEDKLVLLKSLGFKHIQISLDSINNKTLIRLLNVKDGYFERLSRTMYLLDEMGFEWQVNTVITKDNVSINEEIKPLLTYLIKFKNIKSIKFTPMGFPMYKEASSFNAMAASLEDIKLVENYINEMRQTVHQIDLIFSRPNCKDDYLTQNKRQNFERRPICSANQKGFVILPNGEVTICEELYWNANFIIGNIIFQSIQEIWDSTKAKSLFYLNQADVSLDSICKKCSEFTQCRHYKGVCWKMVTMAFGQNRWDYPDPSCPKAPKPDISFYYR